MDAYPYGYCGMPCALCSRYRTEGKSRCPGCSADGYYTATCKAHHCCVEKQMRHCGLCEAFPCARLGKMVDFSDLRTGNAKQRTCADVSSEGFDGWYADYAERADLLTVALQRYNDGRMKRYLCELFLQNDAKTLRELMRRAEGLDGETPKERGAAFKKIVADLD